MNIKSKFSLNECVKFKDDVFKHRDNIGIINKYFVWAIIIKNNNTISYELTLANGYLSGVSAVEDDWEVYDNKNKKEVE